jgi:hypothetical protein
VDSNHVPPRLNGLSAVLRRPSISDQMNVITELCGAGFLPGAESNHSGPGPPILIAQGDCIRHAGAAIVSPRSISVDSA